ncbi:MAG: hypothetical protein HYX41_05145 [Bdellovibrio sp.]|nr:hypothetical protein [Bdellovibrio sp.]
MKKIGLIIGSVFVLLLILIVTLPFFINVDKYRPQIVEAANKEINGTLEMGKLSLSLWGQIRIAVAGLNLKDSGGKELVSVKDAYFHVPFSSIFSGSPSLTFYMKQPLVNVIKNRAGKMNLLSVMKEAPKTSASVSPVGTATAGRAASSPSVATGEPAPVAPARQVAPAPSAVSTAGLPAIATQAHLGIELDHATLNYTDLGTGLKSEVKDLNLRIKDLSLTRPTELELWADLDTKMGKAFMLKGPARLTAKGKPDFKNGVFDSVTLTASLDLDGLDISVPDTFSKKAGIPTHASLTVVATDKSAKIESVDIRFHNLEVKGSGTAGFGDAIPTFNISLKSNQMEFAPWVELVPMLKEFELGGKAQLELSANGTATQPNYKGSLGFSGLTAKAPMLKSQPKFDGMIHFITDQLDQISIKMKAPGNVRP